MISKNTKDATSIVNTYLGFQVFPCLVHVPLGTLEHLLCSIQRTQNEISTLEVFVELILDELKASSGHVRLAYSLDLLYSVCLADIIESPEHFIHDVDDRALTFSYHFIKVAYITEYDSDLACIVAQAVFCLIYTILDISKLLIFSTTKLGISMCILSLD